MKERENTATPWDIKMARLNTRWPEKGNHKFLDKVKVFLKKTYEHLT